MSGKHQLRIGDVVAQTGLTERMIRHYERLGLVAPDRSAAGQRLYDADSLLALAKVSLLKNAGLPLDLIRQWLDSPMDARELVAAQLGYLRCELDRISGSIALLKDLDDALAQGGAMQADDLARIISASGDSGAAARARAFFEKHFTRDQHDDWQDMTARLRAEVDPDAYDNAWRTLSAEIRSALPLDPASGEAQAFLARWDALLEPFRRVASTQQQTMARTMWTNVGEWGEHARQPATQAVTDFISAAYAARRTDGQ